MFGFQVYYGLGGGWGGVDNDGFSEWAYSLLAKKVLFLRKESLANGVKRTSPGDINDGSTVIRPGDKLMIGFCTSAS